MIQKTLTSVKMSRVLWLRQEKSFFGGAAARNEAVP